MSDYIVQSKNDYLESFDSSELLFDSINDSSNFISKEEFNEKSHTPLE